MYLSYGIPRALRSLRTNWRASLNSVLIIAASLSVLGAGSLLYVNVLHVSRLWLANTTVSLFLRAETPAEQRQRLLERVRAEPAVRQASLVAPQEGLATLGRKLGGDHGLLQGVDAGRLPYTIDFDVDAEQRERIGALAAKYRSLGPVEEVVYAERSMEQVRLFLVAVQAVGLFFVGLILLSFLMIVSNAIKLSLHTRRDEIEILAAVGATHRFIRSSFVVEGVLLALGGFAAALAIVWLGYELIVAALTWNETTMVLKTRARFFSQPVLAYTLAGALLLGGAGSHVSVNRLLRRLTP